LKKLTNSQKKDGLMIRNSTAEFLMFTADSRKDGLEVRFQDETVWLTQKLMAELFQCTTDNISLHLKNIFKDCELEEKSVTENSSVTASDGKPYRTKHYNLDAIIAVGYRVSSIRATQFRQWATRVLKEFAIHGQTASETILQRADNQKPYMGLNAWKKGPRGKIQKSDVSIAKNYLSKEEIEEMDRVVSMYLDYAEDQAKRKIPMTMEDWSKKLDAFLTFNERHVLENSW
jgi:hypothetical protein